MRKLAIVFLSLALLATVSATPAYAQAPPGLPHAFYGNVEINNSPAPDGTEVSAIVDTGSIIEVQNPVTTVGGSYGINSPRLLVQGDIPNGATITFYVNGVEAEGQTATFVAGAGPDERDLSVTIAPPAPPAPGVGAGPAPSPAVETTLFGIEASFSISDEGEIQEKIEATSEDEMLTITIPVGTIALDKEGDPLEALEAAVDESPPDPPEDAHVIGLVYDFGPDGATFDPAITFTWSYDPEALPEDVAEEDLVIAYYDEDAAEWVELDCVVDFENNTITASVAHFTTFAIIGRVPAAAPPVLEPAAFTISSLGISPSEVAPSEMVNISVLVANTGGESGSYTVVLKIDGVKEAEERVTVAAGSSQTVSFSVTREEAGSYIVAVDGLSGSFTVVPVVVPPVVEEEEAPPVVEEEEAPPVVEEEEAPVVTPPVVEAGLAWWVWLVIGLSAAVVVGLLVYFLWWRRRLA